MFREQGPYGIFYHRNHLVAIWRDQARPALADATIGTLYLDIRRPAMDADMLRLYEIFKASRRKKNTACFDNYWDGLIEFKKAVGRLALPDIGTADRLFVEQCHKRFETRDIVDLGRAADRLFKELEATSLAPDHPDYINARFQCVAYDTSRVVNPLAHRMQTVEGMAYLHQAALYEDNGLANTLTGDWIDQPFRDSVIPSLNKLEDMQAFREDLFLAQIDGEMQARLAHIEKTHDTERAASAEEADGRRELTFHLVPKPPRIRAA